MNQGRAIKIYLAVNDVEITDLAKRVLATRQTVYNWLGKERLDKAVIGKIADALQVSIDELLTYVNIDKTENPAFGEKAGLGIIEKMQAEIEELKEFKAVILSRKSEPIDEIKKELEKRKKHRENLSASAKNKAS